MADPRTHWPELEKGLTELLASLASLLDDDASERVREFVKNSEFDVTLDWLYAAIVENNIQLSLSQEEKFEQLAGLMGSDLKKAVRNKHWAKLEKELASLLKTFSSSVEAKTFELVQDFIENREYGVALEWLYLAAVLRLNTPLSPFQAQKFDELAGLMEIDLKGLHS